MRLVSLVCAAFVGGALGFVVLTHAQAATTTPMGFVVGDPTLSYWNSTMSAPDQALASDQSDGALNQTTVGTRTVFTTTLSDLPPAISVAQADGAAMVGFNDESTSDCATLVSNEQSAASQAHAAGLGLLWIPTGNALASCIASTPAMATAADAILYQTEYLQESDPTYQSDTAKVVAKLRADAPTHPVWEQVSVNPPAYPTATATQVEADVTALLTSSAPPDGVNLWYEDTTDRINVLESVVTHFS